MPTGYTADVGDGKLTEFRAFALRCARAFGATVTQRDHPMDEPPRHREAAAFYAEWVAASEGEVARLATLSLSEAQQEMLTETREVGERNERWRKEREEKRRLYDAMLVEVRAWEPPTSEHTRLKEFMDKQLVESIDFDCHELTTNEPELVSTSDWLLAKRVAAAEKLSRDLESLREERQRITGANAWIDALYESLGPTD